MSSIMNLVGQIESGYEVVNPKPDKSGLIHVKDSTGKVFRIHKQRLVPDAEVKIEPKMNIECQFTRGCIKQMAELGELLYKLGDHCGNQFTSYYFITDNHFLQFNCYGGSFGKKKIAPDYAALLKGDRLVGYKCEADKLRAKLIKKGFQRLLSTEIA